MPVEPPTPRHPNDVDPAAANFALYNSAAGDYLEYGKERYVGNDRWLLPLLPEIEPAQAARALDVGCAVGTNSRYLAEHGYHVTGIDFSPAMVTAAWAACRSAGLGIPPRFICRDFRTWTSAGEKFDLVLATAFVHLFPNPEDRSVTKEILSHVAPGGTAIVSTTLEPVHSQCLRPKRIDHPDTSVPPGYERWRNEYTEETFWNLIRGVAADTFGTACTVTKHVVQDPGRPHQFWSDITVTRTI